MRFIRLRQTEWLIVRFCKIKSVRWLTLKKTDSGGQVAILRLLLTLTLSWIRSAYKASQPTLQKSSVHQSPTVLLDTILRYECPQS